jgi:RND family efflux transporter MFP subunit
MFTMCRSWEPDFNKEVALPVSVMKVTTGSIEELINTSGTVMPVKDAQVKNEVAGKYRLQTNPSTGRPYKMGDKVALGAVIIILEDKEYEYNLNLKSKKLNMEISKQEYAKQKSLYEKGGVTLRELRNAEVSMLNAENDYNNTLLKLEKMKVRAPFGGYIVDLPHYTNGIRVPAGQEMFRLMAYRKMYVEVNLPEKFMPQVKPRQEVRITSYVIREDTLTGIISEISPALSTETRTFKVMMSIDNPKLRLRPGMFVKADIILQRKDSVIVIPKKYILAENGKKKVFVVQNGLAREHWINTGIENVTDVEVVSGLEKNMSLVVKGFETLRNGSKVKVIQ